MIRISKRCYSKTTTTTKPAETTPSTTDFSALQFHARWRARYLRENKVEAGAAREVLLRRPRLLANEKGGNRPIPNNFTQVKCLGCLKSRVHGR